MSRTVRVFTSSSALASPCSKTSGSFLVLVLGLLLGLSACSFEPASLRDCDFACDGDLVCRDGVCVDPEEDLDGSIGADMGDMGGDSAIPDDIGPVHDADSDGANDTGDGDDGDADTSIPDAQFGEPCEENSDCASGWCIAGSQERVCSKPCQSQPECGSGWMCEATNQGVSLCFQDAGSICELCAEDAECGLIDSACITLLDGTYCSRSCDLRDCPSGTTCLEVTTASGASSSQCVPQNEVCSGCLDEDGDGYGIGLGCLGPDCDDTDADVYPGAPLLCDGRDNNCDGVVDTFSESCYSGPDGTLGVGICAAGTRVCTAGEWGTCEGQVMPQPEVCDNLDNNCDGQVDDFDEPCYTGPQGTLDIGNCSAGTRSCSGGQWSSCVGQVTPQPEICDGQDNNCNGTIDQFTESCYSGPEDTLNVGLCQAGTRTCADGNWGGCLGQVTPEPEVCDGEDNNCNGAIDEGCDCIEGETQPCYSGPSNTQGVGNCRAGLQTCDGGQWSSCTGEVVPQPEICDGEDNNCDGTIDQFTERCYTGPPNTVDVGICSEGERTCTDGSWGSCQGEVLPGAEICGNGIDESCSGGDEPCCAGVASASAVTSTSTCLTAGTLAQSAIVVTLLDTNGAPIVGADVTMSATFGSISAVSASGNIYHAILTAPNNAGTTTVTVTATSPCTGQPVVLTTRPELRVAPAFTDTAGGAGGCGVEGNLRLRVVAADTGTPMPGAHVMIGDNEDAYRYATTFDDAPFGLNTAITDDQGFAHFKDFGDALRGPQIVTAAIAQREYKTFIDIDAADLIIPLAEVYPSGPRGTVTGDLTNLPAPNRDPIELGIAFGNTSIEDLASFRLNTLLAEPECYNSGHWLVGNVSMPKNVFVPRQTIFLATMNKKPFTTSPLDYGTHHLVALGGSVPSAALLDGVQAAIADLTFTHIGVHRDYEVNAPGPATQNINMAPLNTNASCTVANAPASSDAFCFALGDWDSRNNNNVGIGDGRLFLMGLGGTDTARGQSPHTISGLTTIARSGSYANIDYLAASVALYMDSGKSGIPAGTENGVSAVLERSGASFGSAGGHVDFASFLPIRPVFRSGRAFNVENVSSNTAPTPHYSLTSINQVVTETYDVCGTPTPRETSFTLWTIYAPADYTTWTLPTPPTGWPRTTGDSTYWGLVDPVETNEDDAIEWQHTTVYEGLNPNLTYDEIRLGEFRKNVTHVTVNDGAW